MDRLLCWEALHVAEGSEGKALSKSVMPVRGNGVTGYHEDSRIHDSRTG